MLFVLHDRSGSNFVTDSQKGRCPVIILWTHFLSAVSHLMGNECGFLLYSISSVAVFLTATNATIMFPKGVQEVSGLWRNGPQLALTVPRPPQERCKTTPPTCYVTNSDALNLRLLLVFIYQNKQD